VADEKSGINAAKDTERDLEKLQGEWTMVSLEERGEKIQDEVVSRMKLTVNGDQWIVRRRGQDTEQKYTIRIDSSQNPKVLDLTPDVVDRVYGSA